MQEETKVSFKEWSRLSNFVRDRSNYNFNGPFSEDRGPQVINQLPGTLKMTVDTSTELGRAFWEFMKAFKAAHGS